MKKSLWKVGLALGGMVLLLSSSVAAWVLTGEDWDWQASPMNENWRICTTSMPGNAPQRTIDGAVTWNYANFNFRFGTNACLGTVPNFDNVNQINYGDRPTGVLATTFWWTQTGTNNTIECDMQFDIRSNWYTGTGTTPSTQYDWESVADHEFGHCLGLGHEDSITPRPKMASTFGLGEMRRALTTDDRNGRNFIYGTVSCATTAFASRVPGFVGSLPTAIWLVLPVLFVAGWRLSLKRKKGTGSGRT
jgi:hypothetical protein